MEKQPCSHPHNINPLKNLLFFMISPYKILYFCSNKETHLCVYCGHSHFP